MLHIYIPDAGTFFVFVLVTSDLFVARSHGDFTLSNCSQTHTHRGRSHNGATAVSAIKVFAHVMSCRRASVDVPDMYSVPSNPSPIPQPDTAKKSNIH